MATRVVALDVMVDDDVAPAYYNGPGKRAWERGFVARCWSKERDPDPDGRNPYQRRYMRQAWLAGWDAALLAIAKVKNG